MKPVVGGGHTETDRELLASKPGASSQPPLSFFPLLYLLLEVLLD